MTLPNWLLLIGIMMAMNFGGGRARRFIRKHAAFYAMKTIIIVGGLYGIVLGIFVYVVSIVLALQLPAALILFAWGVITVLYVGYQPDEIDWANKAKHVGIIATLSYAATQMVLLFSLKLF